MCVCGEDGMELERMQSRGRRSTATTGEAADARAVSTTRGRGRSLLGRVGTGASEPADVPRHDPGEECEFAPRKELGAPKKAAAASATVQGPNQRSPPLVQSYASHL